MQRGPAGPQAGNGNRPRRGPENGQPTDAGKPGNAADAGSAATAERPQAKPSPRRNRPSVSRPVRGIVRAEPGGHVSRGGGATRRAGRYSRGRGGGFPRWWCVGVAVVSVVRAWRARWRTSI